MMVAIREVFTGRKEIAVDEVGVTPDVSLSFGRDPTGGAEGGDRRRAPTAAGVGPLPPGHSTFEGVLSADELKRRGCPRPAAGRRTPACRRTRSSAASWRSTPSTTTSATTRAWSPPAHGRCASAGRASTPAGSASGFPPPFAITVSFYSNPDGAHKDLREIYEPTSRTTRRSGRRSLAGHPRRGDAGQVGAGQNEGRIWISWRRGGTVYTVSQNVTPGDPQTFDEVARLAKIVDERAAANP